MASIASTDDVEGSGEREDAVSTVLGLDAVTSINPEVSASPS